MSRRVHCTIPSPPPTPPILYMDEGGAYAGQYDSPTRVSFAICDDDHPGWGSWIQFGPSRVRYVTPVTPGDYEGPVLTPALPIVPVPTRAQVCGVRLTFQGLTAVTQQFGRQPWFEPAYQCCTRESDRAAVRVQKLAAGDTHLILEFFTDTGSLYDEPGQPWQAAISPSGEQNPQWFLGLVQEVRESGLIPIVAFDGDNADHVPRGSANALRQLPLLVDLLHDWHTDILYARLWDGVFYGSSPANIEAFGTAFRHLLPLGYLAIEHDPGHIPVGGGPTDYAPGGRMDAYDVIMGEFHSPPNDDATWQVLGRMIRPYHRPPDQPVGDDPNPPFYLVDSPRGPRAYIVFEDDEYDWVRGRIAYTELQRRGAYYRAMGAKFVCLP